MESGTRIVACIRSVRAAEGRFVQIANGAAQDRRLSLRARGVLLFVLSLPPEQHFTAKWLESQVPEGREAVRAALRELEMHGYLRRERTSRGGTWVWDQVISDAPLACDDKSLQVDACDGFPYYGNPSDGKPSHKELNTENTNTEKMVRGRASRRAHASGERATRTVDQVISEVREAVTAVHGETEARWLSDDEALGLYAVYANPQDAPVRDLVAYMTKILSDAPYLDTLMANVEPVCRQCQHWESECSCPAAA